MNVIASELLFLLLLILANGLFAMSEIAIISARKTRLQQRAEGGDKRAQVALDLAKAPNQFLATVQIGITLVGILAGVFGGATLAEPLAAVLSRVPLMANYSEAISVAIVVVAITFLTLVVGELAPKHVGLSHAERVASAVAPSMRTLSRLASPVVRLLSFSTGLLLKPLGVGPVVEEPVDENEINLMLEQGTEVGIFEPGEQELVRQVFRLADRSINALMTPRPDVLWLDTAGPVEEARKILAAAGHSRLPVARDSLDDVLGVVYAKDLLASSLRGQSLELQAALRPALFLPESIRALEAVERLKENHTDLALVIDEYGGIQGLITVNDMLEALVGDLSVEVEPEAVQRADGSWLLGGKLSTDEVKELLAIESLPNEDRAHYQTLGGLVMLCLGRIPAAGDHFDCGDWRFEVVDMDGRRVDKVLAIPAQSDERTADPAEGVGEGDG